MELPLVVTYARLREELAVAEIELQNAKAQMMDNLPEMPSIHAVFAAMAEGQPPPAIERPDARIQAARERELLDANMRIIRLKARLGAMEFAQRERLIAALNNRAGVLDAALQGGV